MSIAEVLRVTIAGHERDRTEVLGELQHLGVLHIVPLTAQGEPADESPRLSARDALHFLASCPQQRRQVKDASRFEARAVQRRALRTQAKIQDLTNERDDLQQRLELMRKWGEFEFATAQEMGHLRFWFYAVPHARRDELERCELPWQVVNRDSKNAYVVVVAEEEPEGEVMPAPRTHVGSRAPAELAARLEEVLEELEDVEAERISLTRWRDLLARAVDRLDDRAELVHAEVGTARCGPLWGLQAWVAKDRAGALRDWAEGRGVLLELAEPGPDDEPPTLLENPAALRGGEDLVHFYTTPGYRVWDPSSAVFFSFAVFFAMIVADAGYALVLGAIVAILWRRLGGSESERRWRVLLATLTAASVVFGVLVGSYFGFTPGSATVLGQMHVLNLQDAGAMMALSVGIGAAHVAYACLRDAFRYPTWSRRMAPLGWAAAVLGGFFLWRGSMTEVAWLSDLGRVGLVGGLAAVFLFTGAGEKFLPRIWKGTTALFDVAGAFGDVMSYIRLFALGLASASLAATFNDMAAQVREATPGIGLLFAMLIFLFGHALNFVLAVSGGFIHGLRLNVIEFFKWGVKEEGTSFQAFEKKGVHTVDHVIMILGWIGVYSPAVLGAIGSSIGVARGGMAACGAMLEVDSGYGRFVGVAALPSTNVIYGVVVMLTLNVGVTLENAPGIFAIGLGAGVALLLAGLAQGKTCAAAINASKAKPEVFGISIAPAAVVEGFAVFAFVFALVLAGSVPGMGAE